jgi:very-short-patch-repair endonuclease
MPPRPRTLIARTLRRDATQVERVLWRALREGGLPWKFRRQHPIGRRIADFACPARKLVIELDGGQHGGEASGDVAREAELARPRLSCHPVLEQRSPGESRGRPRDDPA